MQVKVIGADPAFVDRISARMTADPKLQVVRDLSTTADVLVYIPDRSQPDLTHAQETFQAHAANSTTRLVLASSARVYGALPQNPGLITELRSASVSAVRNTRNYWIELETLANGAFGTGSGRSLVVLRPSTIVWQGGSDCVNRLIQSRIALALPGHDVGIQLLSVDDFAEAVRRAIHQGAGIYNLAPDDAIPLRQAIRIAGGARLPMPRTLQRFFRSSVELDFIRYSWTVANRKIKDETGFAPSRSSNQALLEALGRDLSQAPAVALDPFGMDKSYIAAYGRTLFHFLHRYYWRIEEMGLENIPRCGSAVLVGVHRGFMPWDGVMALHSIVAKLGRYPRFLIHPSLVKFPFLFNYMRKLGGVIACQENAEYLLDRGDLVGIFPEGIRGAFTLYRAAYRVGKFTSDDFVKLALRQGAAIVPFVTVGSAEIFPIFAKWNWNWCKQYTGWPTLPITPTFPFLPPVPLPAKWHTQWLAPVPAGNEYPREAAADPLVVSAISKQVRSAMQEAIDNMVQRRKSVFFGKLFDNNSADSRLTSAKGSFEERIG